MMIMMLLTLTVLSLITIEISRHLRDICYVLDKVKKAGGVSFNSMVPLTKCSEKMVQLILHEYSIHHCAPIFLHIHRQGTRYRKKLQCASTSQ